MADPKREEQKEMLKAMLKGAKEDPKGAALFFRDVAKDAIKKARDKRRG
ncbi:MAG: hypothetical protein V9G04_17690 [Nocardioides sp.]|jgi:chorismate mutase